MKLYHGTNTLIGDIDLSCSKPFKDFGRAFQRIQPRVG